MGVFRLKRPNPAAIDAEIAAAEHLSADGPHILMLPKGLQTGFIPHGLAHDNSRSYLGRGADVFAKAKRTFQQWSMFDLGWARVANPQASIEAGQVVAVEVFCLGLWSLNLSRITDVVDTDGTFGFIYSTTYRHVEQGEERFLLEFDLATGDVWYELEALSRPRNVLARIGCAYTRAMQHRFARDSHRRMKLAVNAELSPQIRN
jgi:uncharacterized protein (UPF0548 family)